MDKKLSKMIPQDKKHYLIYRYKKTLEELIELNSRLYTCTELFEGKTSLNFDFELWNYFKKQQGQITKKYNELVKLYNTNKTVNEVEYHINRIERNKKC